MSVKHEQPKSGMNWDLNAAMYESRRVEALERAERCERDGDADAATFWRTSAEQSRRDRDRHQHEYEKRILNRRAHRRW